VKLHCLGANRVAFGTLAMVSIGCTICRGCQLDTCHVGIATQIDSMAEAEQKGLKKFTPQEFDRAVESCSGFFRDMGEEVRQVVAELGYERAQDLVGRSDLLVQARAKESIDLTEMIRPLEEMLDLEPIDLPASAEEEREHAGLIVARPIRMEPKVASHEIAALAGDICGGPVSIAGAGASTTATATVEAGELVTRSGHVTHEYARAVDAHDRVLGTELAGALSRARIFRPDDAPASTMDSVADLHFNGGSIGGSGLGAFNVWGVDIRVEGGAQDGVGKTMFGGTIAIMKGRNRLGRRVNGSVGKSFAYGAQRGRFFVQGSADSRFCIRLSGADVVIGGEPDGPIEDELGGIADRANIKGFAFEYMTSGRAVVLGDIGPWACAGQTGGRVYMRTNEAWGLDAAALERRMGKGAKVALRELYGQGIADVQELLGLYALELDRSDQAEEAARIRAIAAEPKTHFLMSEPEREQMDPSVSTE
jgi:glutamate synthase (NADPH) large chain